MENEWESLEATVGSTVRQLRQNRQWSQAQLGRKLAPYGFELTQTTVAKLELGQRPLRLNEAAALADLFGVSLESLCHNSADLLDPMELFEEAKRADLVRQRHRLMDELGETKAKRASVVMERDRLHGMGIDLRRREEEIMEELSRLDADLVRFADSLEGENHGKFKRR